MLLGAADSSAMPKQVCLPNRDMLPFVYLFARDCEDSANKYSLLSRPRADLTQTLPQKMSWQRNFEVKGEIFFTHVDCKL